MTSAVVPYLVSGQALERTGNVGYSGQPTSALFTASDGRHISLGVVQQHQFALLAKELDRNAWLSDARYATADLRRKHTRELQAELAEVFSTATAEAWETRLSNAGIPCGMVRDVSEAVSMSGLRERGVTLPLHVASLPSNQDVSIVNAGFLCDHDSPHVSSPPPQHGEHSDEILASLGFSNEERKAILSANTISN